ncbi:MAG: response regulator [Acidobacteriota bacterium]|nr:response regulator [Acidobacteriota bacterium]
MTTGRRKLLLADDSITIQKVISLTFADEGLEVVTVGDGEQALHQLEISTPDIVLADILMPKLNGYEVCAHIKADERFRHIPVVLLVGTFEPFNDAEARRVGADDVLTKPFQSIRNLVNKVSELISGGPSEHEAEIKTTLAPVQTEFLPERRATTESEPSAAAAPEALSSNLTTAPAAVSDHQPPFVDNPSASFASLDLDDQMIKATPAEELDSKKFDNEEFGDIDPDQTLTSYQMPTTNEVTDEQSLHASMNDEGADAFAEPPVPSSSAGLKDWESANAPLPPWEIEAARGATAGGESSTVSRSAYASRMASVAAADDSLLDLGGIDAAPSTTEADDFILDLTGDEPADMAAPVVTITTAPAASASATIEQQQVQAPIDVDFFAMGEEDLPETLHPAAEALPGSSTGIEPQRYETPAPPADSDDLFSDELFMPPLPVADAEPLMGSTQPSAAANGTEPAPFLGTTASTGAQQIRLEQLSPEVIDAIARRVVELMSDRVVREVAWDVVPELAERLIKRRLNEDGGGMQ